MGRALRLVLALVCLVAFSLPGVLAAQVVTPAASPPAGVAVSLRAGMDSSVRPGDDFFRYATGAWQDRTDIPADRGAYGVAEEVEDLTIAQLLGLLESLAADDVLPEGSDAWKAVRLFAQGVDYEKRNAQGVSPIAGDLAAIEAIATRDDLYAFLRRAALETYAWGLFGIYASPDLADSSIYTAWYMGPILGLPNRDYYWVDDESNETVRQAYRQTSAELLQFIGYDDAAATDAAERVYAFEKRLAEPLLRPEDFYDPANYYNPRPVADLIAANPDFDWPAFLQMLGIPDQETIVVEEVAYLEAIDDILAATDLQTIKDYLTLQILWLNAFGLTQEMNDTASAFTGGVLQGSAEQRPIEEQALFAVNGALGFALGKLYVEAHFPPEAKAEIEALAKQLKEATRARIDRLAWMSPETKDAALAKLDSLNVKVGYPDAWQTYENVTIGDSYAASLLSANITEYRRQLARIGQPVDRDEWYMLPQEVNAYYDALNNEIVFPAGILQPPYFDHRADPAYNYGGIGATIGHEITHAYDPSGALFDAQGNFTDWWSDEDYDRFDTLNLDVIAQFNEIDTLPGLKVDGELTVGENVADMGGLQIAYDALQATLAEEGDPGLIEGLTQEQRFFIAYTASWAEEARPEYLDTQVRTDFHAPSHVRAVQPVRNMEAFYAAFGIGEDDPMWLPPEERIVIW